MTVISLQGGQSQGTVPPRTRIKSGDSGSAGDRKSSAPGPLLTIRDVAPSPAWPPEDVEHYRRVTFPAIVRAVADATGRRGLGVCL